MQHCLYTIHTTAYIHIYKLYNACQYFDYKITIIIIIFKISLKCFCVYVFCFCFVCMSHIGVNSLMSKTDNIRWTLHLFYTFISMLFYWFQLIQSYMTTYQSCQRIPFSFIVKLVTGTCKFILLSCYFFVLSVISHIWGWDLNFHSSVGVCIAGCTSLWLHTKYMWL